MFELRTPAQPVLGHLDLKTFSITRPVKSPPRQVIKNSDCPAELELNAECRGEGTHSYTGFVKRAGGVFCFKDLIISNCPANQGPQSKSEIKSWKTRVLKSFVRPQRKVAASVEFNSVHTIGVHVTAQGEIKVAESPQKVESYCLGVKIAQPRDTRENGSGRFHGDFICKIIIFSNERACAEHLHDCAVAHLRREPSASGAIEAVTLAAKKIGVEIRSFGNC